LRGKKIGWDGVSPSSEKKKDNYTPTKTFVLRKKARCAAILHVLGVEGKGFV